MNMTQVAERSEVQVAPTQNKSATASDRSIIYTDKAPVPLGTYSQGVKVGNMIFLAAQTPVVPGTNDIAEGGFEGQVRQTFSNLKTMAEACGGTLADVVQVTVYITDISKFTTMNAIMAEYFTQPYPARTTVGAAQLARNTLVAIDAIMVTRS
jgi:2-iminobutanoate/2-iminopropanoate deaminase